VLLAIDLKGLSERLFGKSRFPGAHSRHCQTTRSLTENRFVGLELISVAAAFHGYNTHAMYCHKPSNLFDYIVRARQILQQWPVQRFPLPESALSLSKRLPMQNNRADIKTGKTLTGEPFKNRWPTNQLKSASEATKCVTFKYGLFLYAKWPDLPPADATSWALINIVLLVPAVALRSKCLNRILSPDDTPFCGKTLLIGENCRDCGMLFGQSRDQLRKSRVIFTDFENVISDFCRVSDAKPWFVINALCFQELLVFSSNMSSMQNFHEEVGGGNWGRVSTFDSAEKPLVFEISQTAS
jgi:hypothetical protein